MTRILALKFHVVSLIGVLLFLQSCKSIKTEQSETMTSEGLNEFKYEVSSEDECKWVYEETGLDWVFQNVAKPGYGVKIATIDTGYLPHPHIEIGDQKKLGNRGGILLPRDEIPQVGQESVLAILNYVEANKSDDPLDYYNGATIQNWGHGISVASVILTPANKGPFRGIAPHAQIIPYRVAKFVFGGFPGMKNTGDPNNYARAIINAVDQGVDIINVSMGGLVDSHRPIVNGNLRDLTWLTDRDGPIKRAVAYAEAKGVVIIASGGHGPSFNFIPVPARYPYVFAVAGSRKGKKIWEYTFGGELINAAAPAAGICYSRPKQLTPLVKMDEKGIASIADDYHFRVGTGSSFAAASASGIAAIWFGLAKNKYPDKVERAKIFIEAFKESMNIELDTSGANNPGPFPNLINARYLIEPLVKG